MEQFEYPEIVKIIKEWKNAVGLNAPVQISKDPGNHRTLYLYTTHPGSMVGPYGYWINQYKEIITKKFPMIKEVKIVETFRMWA